MVDGEIDSNEFKIIFNIAQKIGVTKEEFDFVLNNNDSVKDKVPVSFKDKHLQLCHLIAMMFVDGKIDNAELNYCYQLSEKLGFGKLEVHLYIDLLSSTVIAHNDFQSAVDKFLEITSQT